MSAVDLEGFLGLCDWRKSFGSKFNLKGIPSKTGVIGPILVQQLKDAKIFSCFVLYLI